MPGAVSRVASTLGEHVQSSGQRERVSGLFDNFHVVGVFARPIDRSPSKVLDAERGQCLAAFEMRQ